MLIRQKRVNKIEAIGIPSEVKQVVISYSLQNKFNELSKIGFSSENLQDGDTLLPSVIGPVSRFNAHGRYIIRRDLPKERRVIGERVWSWTQWSSNGTTEEHSKTVDIERDCYPRDFISPTAKEFTYNQNKILSTTINVSQSEDLRHTINLFLEFFGECELVKDDLSAISKIKITRRPWEFLPQGENPWERVAKYLESCGVRETAIGIPIIQRQEFLNSYQPKEVALGTAGFKGYLAYVFNAIVILESVRYGNAIYVFEKNWEEFSKLTKAEIISEKFYKDRIIHCKGWQEKIQKILT